MNKHLKCVLKVLGAIPMLVLVMILIFPSMIFQMLAGMSGCIKMDTPWFILMIEWYEKL